MALSSMFPGGLSPAGQSLGRGGIPGMAGFGFGDATETEEERHKRQGIVPLRLGGLRLGTHT
jgi:hypothetical protein